MSQLQPKFLGQLNEAEVEDPDSGHKGSVKITLEKIKCTDAKKRSLLRMGSKDTMTVKSRDGLKMAEVALTNNHNYDYIGKFSYGNPPQKMRACFDTGSANGWVLSSKCTNDRCKPGSHNFYYTPTLSSTFKDLQSWTTISFGSGKLRGFFA
jgi:hypothetical protein